MCGLYVDISRCDIVRDFLAGDCDWLFMLDADMAWDSDTLHRMLKVADPIERPVVAGLYFSGGRMGGPLYPLIFRLGEDGHTHHVLDYERDALIPIDSTGGGLILWHRTVLEAMAKAYELMPDGSPNPLPWFSDEIRDGHIYGEDTVACLRARALGFPIVMHTGIQAVHKKPAFLNEQFYDQVRAAQARATEVPDA